MRAIALLCCAGTFLPVLAGAQSPAPAAAARTDPVDSNARFQASAAKVLDEMRAKQGKDFSVKGFNNKFLSYGNAPVRSIRELMLAGQ